MDFNKNQFGGLKNRRKNRIPEDFFFSLCFPEEFFTGTWFWRGSQEFLFLAAVTGFFCRNSCGTGIPVFTPDSSGFFLIPPDSCSRQMLSGSGQPTKSPPTSSPPASSPHRSALQALQPSHACCIFSEIPCHNDNGVDDDNDGDDDDSDDDDGDDEGDDDVGDEQPTMTTTTTTMTKTTSTTTMTMMMTTKMRATMMMMTTTTTTTLTTTSMMTMMTATTTTTTATATVTAEHSLTH